MQEEISRRGFTILDTAGSNHLSCFICGRRREKLYVAPSKSIAFAYKYLGLVIKTHARLCSRHLINDNSEIRESEFINIHSTRRYFPHETVRMFDLFCKFLNLEETPTIFEPFKNLNTLNEFHCKQITSWTVSEFIRFSSYLTSWKKSDGRDKDEIIALYRYYMKKGLTQATVAILRGNTSQREISRYLEQMRHCINQDFVPYFIGIVNRNREFFLSHQTPTCKIIFKLSDEILVLLADG